MWPTSIAGGLAHELLILGFAEQIIFYVFHQLIQ